VKAVAIMGGVSYDVRVSLARMTCYPAAVWIGNHPVAAADINGFGVRGRLRLPSSPQATHQPLGA
jgi:hypothetical protein